MLASMHKLRHHAIGQTWLVGKVVQIPVGVNKARWMPKIVYVLASPDGHVKVFVIGSMVQKFTDVITGLKGSVVTVDNTEWDDRHGV